MEEDFYIQWHITNQCQLRCRHCYQDDFTTSQDLDWPGLKAVSDNLIATMEKWGRKATIHLTGGEPLIKPELFPLLEYLDQKPAVEELGLITNGLLIDREVLRRLSLFSKLRKMKISLDGAEAGTNDLIRSRGTFAKMMEKASLVQRENRWEILVMFTLIKTNFRELPSLLRLCRDLGVNGLILERFIPLGRGKGIVDRVLGKEDWKEVGGILLDLFSVDGAESLSPYQAFQINFEGEEMALSGAPCVVGTDGLCIMPDGSVLPCRRFPLPIGNLMADSLATIWDESEVLEKVRTRRNLKGKCGTCEVESCCGCRSLALALTGDYLAEDPHCCKPAYSPTI